MDKVVYKQNQFQRALEKQLDDIEVSQRQAEARRLRKIKDLGVDLSRIHSTSRHLQAIEDLGTRQLQPRRGSLPSAVGRPSGLSLNFESPTQPRSRRRLSCIAAIRVISPDSEMSAAKKDTHRPSNIKDIQEKSAPTPANLQVSKEDLNDISVEIPATKSKTSLADIRHGTESVDMATRRGSLGAKNNEGHNITTVYVHEDKHASPTDAASSADRSPEEEPLSSPDIIRRRGRRASEPAVGGYFIRRLQATVYNDTQLVQQRSTVESAELRRSIQKYLPSDIVAEEDEEEGDSKCISRSTDDIPRHFSGTSEKLDSSKDAGKGSQDNAITSSKDVKTKDLPKDKAKTAKGNQTVPKTGSSNPSRARRSSDGDVLTYIARKFNHDRRGLGDSSARSPRILSAASRNKNISAETSNENSDVWQAVRKCRYLRGYDPPEMTEPANVREFVFGHEDIDSIPPESK
ncbi:hypothetical protein BsWGS_25473 [Bradybaena similaris]